MISTEQIIGHDAFTGGYPWDAWAELRTMPGLPRFDHPEWGSFRVASRYADVKEISRQPLAYASGPRSLVSSLGESPVRTLVSLDPPEHATYRRVVSPWFTPRNINRLEQRLRDYSRELLSARAGSGPFDFVDEIASRLPLRLICELLGIDRHDEDDVLDMTNAVLAASDPEFSGGADESAATMEGLGRAFEFLGKLAERGRTEPRDDLASLISNAKIDGSPLPEGDVLGYFLILMTAGHDTTRNATSGGLLALVDHAKQWQQLRQSPLERSATAADEVVRWTSPVVHFMRTTTAAVDIAGDSLEPDEAILLLYPSANRDRSVFDEPETFDVLRAPNPHMGFGFGEHFCLGASLARLELRVFLEELASSVSSVTAVSEPEWLRSNFVSGVKHLSVEMERA